MTFLKREKTNDQCCYLQVKTFRKTFFYDREKWVTNKYLKKGRNRKPKKKKCLNEMFVYVTGNGGRVLTVWTWDDVPARAKGGKKKKQQQHENEKGERKEKIENTKI